MTPHRKTKTTNPSAIPDSIPLFLKKTYHMIDSCDPKIAGWSEDGETFVVKDPSKFESEIIPQFFKHSKFTSFVRQLNFYSFRKIKYVDTIRLDPKLEAETANFWRFRHENFQRGKPHLLTEIKRMTASQSRAASEKASKTENSGESNPQDSAMQQEINTLKKKLEEMNRNMTELTSMVQQVSLKDNDTATVQPGIKRKKVEFATPTPELLLPEPAISDAALTESSAWDSPYDNNMFPTSSDEMDAMDAALEVPLPMPMPTQQRPSRASSAASNMTDSDFVDQLFDVFGQEEAEGDLPEPVPVTSATPVNPQQQPQDNRPDPRLMDRLSEALAVLPKSMQEQIVNRLIDNVTSGAMGYKQPLHAVDTDNEEEQNSDQAQQTPEQEMPLAAATLASLLSYYSKLVKEQEENGNSNKRAPFIPIVPCHA